MGVRLIVSEFARLIVTVVIRSIVRVFTRCICPQKVVFRDTESSDALLICALKYTHGGVSLSIVVLGCMTYLSRYSKHVIVFLSRYMYKHSQWVVVVF